MKKNSNKKYKAVLKLDHIYVIWGVLIIGIAFIFLVYPKVSEPQIEYDINPNTIWNKKVVVKVSKDSISKYPIKYYEYCINSNDSDKDCDWKITNTKNVEVYENGVNYVFIRGVDEKDRKSKSVVAKLSIDNNSPIINDIKVINKTNNSITIKAKAQDILSNIKYYYSIDGLNYVQANDEYTFDNLSSKTKYKLYTKIIDEAENEQIAVIEETTL